MGSGEGKVVCVTGANGYMATWLVKFLLLRGYTVKGTVRNPNDAKKTEHLLKLEGAKERLHLFKADLLDEGSYDSAVEGCEGVFHMASPCFNDTKNPEADLVEPAVKGTLNVLRSCAKSPCLKRVILTSSIAAVAYNWTPRTADVVIDETWYSDPEYLKQNNMWYLLSKYLAEETAWKFVKEHNIDMVALHAGMVIGPLLQPTINESADSVLKLLNGVKTYPNFVIGWVHVQDVINAHIQAYEIPSANGRYLLIESVQHYADIVRILRELFPTLELPEKCEDENPLRPRYQVSKEKAKSLGIDFIPIEVSLKETLESFKEKKFVNY